MIEARGTGSGKVIVLGEHAVVHGEPALVVSLSRRVEVVLRVDSNESSEPVVPSLRVALAAAIRALRPAGLQVDARDLGISVAGEVPIGMGLGSSAALAVGLVRALMKLDNLPGDERYVAVVANEVEREFHGTPSGIDACAAAVEGLLLFRSGPPPQWESVTAPAPLPLVVALSGERHQTAKTVGGLGDRARAAPQVYRPIFERIGALVRAGSLAMQEGAWETLGELMSSNHEELKSCGVSTAGLDRLVREALEEGALGAKLTGAGGGGAIVALARGAPARLAEALSSRGWTAFVAGAADSFLDRSEPA